MVCSGLENAALDYYQAVSLSSCRASLIYVWEEVKEQYILKD